MNVSSGNLVLPRSSGEYVAPLDGLRALSITLVVFSHFGFNFVPGLFGVTIFFFVSGYLITGQLLDEHDRSGSIKLGSFYIRRIMRLYPALVAFVAVSFIVMPQLGIKVSAGDTVAALFYAANYYTEFGGFDPGPAPGAASPFTILWSLAVEEHYYLLFPFLVFSMRGKLSLLVTVLLALIGVVSLWRLRTYNFCLESGCVRMHIEHMTDTRIDSILYGAVLATLIRSKWAAVTIGALRARISFLCGAALLFSALVIRDPWFRDTFRFTVQGFGLMLCVGGLLFAPHLGGLRKAFSLWPILVLGRWSYSLYLWHWFVRCVIPAVVPPDLAPWSANLWLPSMSWIIWGMPVVLVASLGLSAASYYAIERPMVKLRRRFGSHAIADMPRNVLLQAQELA